MLQLENTINGHTNMPGNMNLAMKLMGDIYGSDETKDHYFSGINFYDDEDLGKVSIKVVDGENIVAYTKADESVAKDIKASVLIKRVRDYMSYNSNGLMYPFEWTISSLSTLTLDNTNLEKNEGDVKENPDGISFKEKREYNLLDDSNDINIGIERL